MRNPGGTVVQVWEASDAPGVLDEETLELVPAPPTLIGTARASFGTLKAEERANAGAAFDEQVDAYALLPLGAPVTADRYLVIDGHPAMAGTWEVVGVEWRPTHLRAVLRQT